MPATLRIGRQVLSWGESTFIPNGINSINPIDVAKLRTPGSELKEALLPVNMVVGLAQPHGQPDRSRRSICSTGSAPASIRRAPISARTISWPRAAAKSISASVPSPTPPPLGAILRGTDSEPSNSGQYGVNLRWLAERLNDTEFGLYYMNYHSRLPMISARTPTSPISSGLGGQPPPARWATTEPRPGCSRPAFGAGTPCRCSRPLSSVPPSPACRPAPCPPAYAAFYPAAQSIASSARDDRLPHRRANGPLPHRISRGHPSHRRQLQHQRQGHRAPRGAQLPRQPAAAGGRRRAALRRAFLDQSGLRPEQPDRQLRSASSTPTSPVTAATRCGPVR